MQILLIATYVVTFTFRPLLVATVLRTRKDLNILIEYVRDRVPCEGLKYKTRLPEVRD